MAGTLTPTRYDAGSARSRQLFMPQTETQAVSREMAGTLAPTRHDARISHDPVVGWPATKLQVATAAAGTQQYSELAALPISHTTAPPAPEPELPCEWSNWAEPARREVDAWVDPRASRPHGTLHLSTKPDLRADNESRLVSVDDVDFARRYMH